VLPDPYLVRPVVKDAVMPPSRPTPTHLRVVK
jgi:hypothetical protein